MIILVRMVETKINKYSNKRVNSITYDYGHHP